MPARTHHSEEPDGEGDLRVLRCDGLLAGIHVCFRNGYRTLQHPPYLNVLADSAHIPLLSQQYTPVGKYARYTTCTMHAFADSAWYMYRIVTALVWLTHLNACEPRKRLLGRGRSPRHNKRFRGSEGHFSVLVHTREVTI